MQMVDQFCLQINSAYLNVCHLLVKFASVDDAVVKRQIYWIVASDSPMKHGAYGIIISNCFQSLSTEANVSSLMKLSIRHFARRNFF